MRSSYLSAFALLVVGLATACSSTSGNGASSGAASSGAASGASSGGASGAASGAGAAPDGGTVSMMVTAAAGGTVTGTGFSLNIPAGALAADTTITVTPLDKASQPDAASIAGPVLQFGPDGTMFSQPVALTLDFSGTAPAGKVAMMAYLKNGAWVTLPDSAVTGSKVTASTTHFTPFTIIWTTTADGGIQQSGGSCGSYAPCGGDPTGNWKFTAGCYSFAPGSPDPIFRGMCAGATTALTVDIGGTVSLAADKTYAVNETFSASIAVTFPIACLEGGPCQDIAGSFTATGQGTSCTLTQVPRDAGAPMTTTSAGTWSVGGSNSIAFLDTGDGGSGMPDMADYCVKGNMFSVRSTDKKGNVIIYFATKQ